MSKRNFQDRKEKIEGYLTEHKQASVGALCSLLGVSEVTIRKDLTRLEEAGLLIRKFGGAVLKVGGHLEVVADSESGFKGPIAEAAVGLVDNHSRIVIDCGKTTSIFAQKLRHQRDGLVVMTNALTVAEPLINSDNSPTVLMSGGTWDRKTQSFQGQLSEQLIEAYDFDQLFVGADGIDIERGTTTFNELTNLSRVMAKASKQVIVLAESKKIGRKIPNLELAWSQINLLVTDHLIAPSYRQAIEQKGIEVMVVA